jgi:hypothetical protein
VGVFPEAIRVARRDHGGMTMYLPNDDLRPTGSEVAEFIDGASVAEDVAAPASPADPGREPRPDGETGLRTGTTP